MEIRRSPVIFFMIFFSQVVGSSGLSLGNRGERSTTASPKSTLERQNAFANRQSTESSRSESVKRSETQPTNRSTPSLVTPTNSPALQITAPKMTKLGTVIFRIPIAEENVTKVHNGSEMRPFVTMTEVISIDTEYGVMEVLPNQTLVAQDPKSQFEVRRDYVTLGRRVRNSQTLNATDEGSPRNSVGNTTDSMSRNDEHAGQNSSDPAALELPTTEAITAVNYGSKRHSKSLLLFKELHEDKGIVFKDGHHKKVVKFIKSLVEDAPWEQLFMRMVRMVVDEFVDKILAQLFASHKEKRSLSYPVQYAVVPLDIGFNGLMSIFEDSSSARKILEDVVDSKVKGTTLDDSFLSIRENSYESEGNRNLPNAIIYYALKRFLTKIGNKALKHNHEVEASTESISSTEENSASSESYDKYEDTPENQVYGSLLWNSEDFTTLPIEEEKEATNFFMDTMKTDDRSNSLTALNCQEILTEILEYLLHLPQAPAKSSRAKRSTSYDGTMVDTERTFTRQNKDLSNGDFKPIVNRSISEDRERSRKVDLQNLSQSLTYKALQQFLVQASKHSISNIFTSYDKPERSKRSAADRVGSKTLWYQDEIMPNSHGGRNSCSLRAACNAGRLLSRLPAVQDLTLQLKDEDNEPHWDALLWGMQKRKCSKIMCRRYRGPKGSKNYRRMYLYKSHHGKINSGDHDIRPYQVYRWKLAS